MGVRASSFLTLNRRSLKKHKKSTPVVIRGIVPGSPAALTKQLEEGDEIVRVNGQNVTIKNIEMILSVITDEVSKWLLQ
jgi:C-terminal processing protease CtpA/Prc